MAVVPVPDQHNVMRVEYSLVDLAGNEADKVHRIVRFVVPKPPANNAQDEEDAARREAKPGRQRTRPQELATRLLAEL
eukprot:scaffold612_cov343-Prasinococcus_capsulatus_cf.AAC.7